MIVSIIISAYNEEQAIEALYETCVTGVMNSIAKGLVDDFEIWFINDGSIDNTSLVVKRLIEKNHRVHLIDFRKNFGKATALNAGFHHAVGDIVFTIDADLQDDPKEFSRFLEKIQDGYDLVVGWKNERKDSIEKKIPSKIYNKVTSWLSGVYLHDHDCGFKCFRREVIESLDLYGELHRFIPVLAYRNGFKITEITVEHHKRKHGKSKYGIERYMRGALDALTTIFLLKFSDRPMYLFGRLGFLSGFIGFLICLYLTVAWLMGESLSNRPLLVLGVLLIVVGIQFISIGFLGNMIIDLFRRNHYSEDHIREII